MSSGNYKQLLLELFLRYIDNGILDELTLITLFRLSPIEDGDRMRTMSVITNYIIDNRMDLLLDYYKFLLRPL